MIDVSSLALRTSDGAADGIVDGAADGIVDGCDDGDVVG